MLWHSGLLVGRRPFLAVQIQSKLKRFDVAGGMAATLGDVRVAVASSWNDAGTILFGSSGSGPIQRLSTGDPPLRR